MRRPARWSSIGSSPSSMNDDDNISWDELSESIVNLGICVLEDKLRAMVAKIDAHGRRGIQRPIRGGFRLGRGGFIMSDELRLVLAALGQKQVKTMDEYRKWCGTRGGRIRDPLRLELHPRGCYARDADDRVADLPEQRMDMVFIVEKMGVALPLDDGDDEFVVAEEQKKWDVNNDGFRHILAEELRKKRLISHGETGESVLPLSHFRTSHLFPLRSPFNGKVVNMFGPQMLKLWERNMEPRRCSTIEMEDTNMSMESYKLMRYGVLAAISSVLTSDSAF
ncbi:Calmodulin-like protein 3 [Striga hermonthica]|uniref:Calmodulin-like protein 3 n=1 Tax=Striga hermonthica TaxID=68872 RepID=A0A9N7R2G4_STRHE|nr:Calmodulin-like protein 3 [Striga hermonthica]